ncbi:MAG: ABC transporter permease [Candidatus Hodarchaeota archaeon]
MASLTNQKHNFNLIIRNLELRISTPFFRRLGLIIPLLFFLIIVVMPIAFLFANVLFGWEEITQLVFTDPILQDRMWQISLTAIIRSFQIATIVTIIGLLIGIPAALILARLDFPGKSIIDTLIDIPMAVPTSALGFSIFLFWGRNDGLAFLFGLETGILSRGPLLIIAVHVAFSYPYIVRSVKAVIEEIDTDLEIAARTLGAPSMTTFRTITAPLMKEAIVAGAILSFTRSLGETGATYIVCGIFETAPIIVVSWVKTLRIPAAAFLAMLLVVIAIFLLLCLRLFARYVGLPIQRIWVRPERLLSGKWQSRTRNGIVLFVFLLFVLIPALFVLYYLFLWLFSSPYTGDPTAGAFYQIFFASDRKWMGLWSSFLTSLQVATLVTIINLIFGIPMAFIIVRKKNEWGKLCDVLDAIVDVPLVIPSSVLGFSAYWFWGSNGVNLFFPGFFLIVITHVLMTYPFCVRPLVAVIEQIPPEYEEAAFTLGAPAFRVFRSVTLPIMKTGILSAGIMVFTRSLSETGATLIVMGLDRTIPVMIIDWVESGFSLPAAAFACAILILLSSILILFLRRIPDEIREGGE